MFQERQALYQRLETARQSKVILYVTGDRAQLETQIGKDAVALLVHHLDLIEHASKITLYLYTNGGDVIASWSVANLIRQFCDCFEVIVSSKALSGGTLICLGADGIVMTKQAVLGPIDPSTNSPLNPQSTRCPATCQSSRQRRSNSRLSGFCERELRMVFASQRSISEAYRVDSSARPRPSISKPISNQDACEEVTRDASH